MVPREHTARRARIAGLWAPSHDLYTHRSPLHLTTAAVPLERLGSVLEAWPNLKFGYSCRDKTSGPFWSDDANAFVQASMWVPNCI